MVNWTTASVPADPSEFESWAEVDALFETQIDIWSATKPNALTRGAKLVVERCLRALINARQVAQNQRNQGYGVQHAFQLIKTVFADEGEAQSLAIFSDALDDARFLDVASGASFSGALFHAGMTRGLVSVADARDREDLIGAMWEIAPGLQATSELADLLQRERENSRQSVRRLISEAERKDRARLNEWEDKLQAASSAYVGWARRRSTRWGKHTRAWEERHISAEHRIRSVEETYREHMGLKAPVEYWTNRAKEHRKSEILACGWVVLFFPIALLGLAYSFVRTGQWLVVHATAPIAEGALTFPTAIFVVASAGLASCAGLVFWAGRLLTKLYLSHHHLRQDAEERATMTETYLALIENGAASTEDRQVILNALFRNTPDGIVKEDGGLDPSIAAALGKFLAK